MSIEPVDSPAGPPTHRGRGRGVELRRYARTKRIDLPLREHADRRPLPSPIPESALYPVVARSLTELGYSCWRDVCFLGRWIDLYAVHSDTAERIAVELKVADWSRATKQAQLVQAAAHRTYIGIWAPYAHRVQTSHAVARLTAGGLGAMAVNGECHELVAAVRGAAAFSRYVILPKRPTHRAA
jgi:hypothetical protein